MNAAGSASLASTCGRSTGATVAGGGAGVRRRSRPPARPTCRPARRRSLRMPHGGEAWLRGWHNWPGAAHQHTRHVHRERAAAHRAGCARGARRRAGAGPLGRAGRGRPGFGAVAAAGAVGEHQAAVVEDPDSLTHYFAATQGGYRGWRWSITARPGRDDTPVTVDEVALLPGPDALVAPVWVPWEQRVRPGDLGVGDLLPAAEDDERLVPAYLASGRPAVEEVAREIGLGRVQVLSREGRMPPRSAGTPGRTGLGWTWPAPPRERAAPAVSRPLPVPAGRVRRVRQRVHPGRRLGGRGRLRLRRALRRALRADVPGRGGGAGLRRRRRPAAGGQPTADRTIGVPAGSRRVEPDPFDTAGLRAAVLAAWRPRRPASGRTPTSRRTCGSTATRTPGSSSWPRTRRTPPGPAGRPAGSGCS